MKIFELKLKIDKPATSTDYIQISFHLFMGLCMFFLNLEYSYVYEIWWKQTI